MIFVTECGSRAYGLESDESDYDIRFVYINKDKSTYDNYMGVNLKTDFRPIAKVDQETITGMFEETYKVDWQGWDITKALKHLYDMNPSIYEWVFSPVIYYNNQNYDFLKKAKEYILSQKRISPMIRHYRSMGKKYFEDYIDDEIKIGIKKYSVVARCCIMAKWLLLFSSQFIDSEKEFTTEAYEVLSEINNFLPKAINKRIRKVLALKRSSPDVEVYVNPTKEQRLNNWFRVILYETDVECAAVKVSEDYTPESFKKYNRLLRIYFDKLFNN